MPRKRTIDPTIWSDEKFCQLSLKARLLFIGLFSNADDEGFIHGNSIYLRSTIFPYENWTEEEIISLRKELLELKMIEIFGGKIGTQDHEYIHLPRWWDYQPKPDYPTPSKIANSLIDMGKLDRKNLATIHRNFCRKNARRKASRTEKKSQGVGVGLGVGVGVGVGKDKTISPLFLQRAEKLKTFILQNNPSAKVKDSGWGDIVRLMVERDKRTLEQIDAVIEWSQGDDFEKTNVLSMKKIRERFDSLTMKMKRAKRGRESNICPACHKPMADQGDHWFCSDCRQKYKKAI